MTLHPFRKKVRTFRSSRQPVAHNKRIAPHRFCVNLAQLPKCGAKICAILISGFPADVRLRNRLREIAGSDPLKFTIQPSGRRARLLTRDCLSALRRLSAAGFGNLRTLFLQMSDPKGYPQSALRTVLRRRRYARASCAICRNVRQALPCAIGRSDEPEKESGTAP